LRSGRVSDNVGKHVDRLRLTHLNPDKCDDVFPSASWFGDVCLRLDRAIKPQGSNHGQLRQCTFNAGVGGAWRNAEPALGSSARAFSQSDGAGERRVWIYPGELSWELHVLKAILSRRWPTCNFCSVTGFPRCSSSVQYSAHKNTLRSCNERSLRRVKSEGVRNNTLKFWGLLR
ncbi:MAG: hypothetical protein QOE55_3458, partial [Acidobacteriaceae bacterium]|nr:hypothetical protein [Acidobacteriaceae bacterium]